MIVAFAMVMMVYYALYVNKKVYINEIGRSSLLLAEEMFKRMDQRLFHLVGQFQIETKTDSLQKALSLSNDEFNRLPDVAGYIRTKDEDRTSTKKAAVTPFMAGLTNNTLARHLREIFIYRFGQQYGFTLIQEIIVTNKYGANIAISSKTTDYNQSDEEWWQQARDKGVFVGRIAYDESVSSYGINLAIRIDDTKGRFAGVLKFGLDVKDVIREAEVGTRKYNTTQVQIVTDDGKLIYSTKAHRFLDDVRGKPFFRHLKNKEGYFTINGARARLFSFARSKGFKFFKGFDWILIISHQLDEVLEPYFSLQKQIITIACFFILFCIALIFVLEMVITSPLTSLADGIKSLSEGRLDQRVVVKSHDEFGDLAAAFNIMLETRQRAEDERTSLETQLQQSQKMESIGTLAGGIAHDFNNILASIIGFAELSLDEAEKGTLLHSNLEEVLIAGQRAKDLVLQILTFSRQADQEQSPVQVSLVVKEALKLLRASIPTIIEIQENVSSNAVVMGDATRIHQVLMNLCTNAAHAIGGKGGVLTVHLADVELDSEFILDHTDLKPGPYINLTVTDTGQGMAPDVLDKIFDPFFSTKEKGQGTGMGLSVVHGIVHSHGGTIYTYSEPGKGSTFKVFLPAIERRLKPEDKIERPVPTGTERILLIDDEPAILNMGKQTLESLGYDVVTRTASIEALEYFKAQPDKVDLVITDMTMPKMTGEVLAQELIKVRPDIPIILCTGFSAMIDEQKAMAMGIRAFVSKPVLKREIAETIRSVLDG